MIIETHIAGLSLSFWSLTPPYFAVPTSGSCAKILDYVNMKYSALAQSMSPIESAQSSVLAALCKTS